MIALVLGGIHSGLLGKSPGVASTILPAPLYQYQTVGTHQVLLKSIPSLSGYTGQSRGQGALREWLSGAGKS